MRVRFQADADLDGRILRGLRRAAPEIDMRTAAEARLAGLDDSEVLWIAAGAQSSRVVLLREAIPIAVAIEELALIWSASNAEEWIDRLVWIPL